MTDKLRELTRKEFKFFKTFFLIGMILNGIYFIFFAKIILSNIMSGTGFFLSLIAWCIFKRHELYNGKYKEG